MQNPFGDPVLLLREAAKSPLGVLSLMMLLASILAYSLFSRASEVVRLGAFVLVLVAFVGFILAIARLLVPSADSASGPDELQVRKGWASTVVVPTDLRHELIRCSISGLIRIEVDGLYLLVKGHRIPHQFQPVGGVYKRYPPCTRELEQLGVRDDDKMPIDEDSQDDLRVRVPGAAIPDFVRWLTTRTGRELVPWREFSEELVQTGILDAPLFPFAALSYAKTHTTGVRWSDPLQCHELLVADVFELHPTPGQRVELQRLQREDNPGFRWFAAEEIRSRGLSSSAGVATIPPTAEWLL